VNREREGGQATVEVALLLPLLALLLLAVVQVGLVVREAAVAAVRLDPDRLSVELSGSTEPGGRLTVTVRYRTPTAVPLAGALAGDRTLVAEATMRVE